MKYFKIFSIALLMIFLTSCTDEDVNYITSAVVNSEGHLVLTYSDGTTLDQGLVIPEVVDIEVFLVNFYNTEGHIISTQLVEEGEDAFAPTLNLPENVAFDDWDNGFTNVTMNLNIHPIYHYETFTVSFHGTVDSVPEMTGINYGEAITLPEPEVTGKTFLGWYESDSPYAPRINMYTEIYGDMNLYARYEDIVYTVTYHTNGGTEVMNQEALYGDLLAVPEIPFKEDCFYNGWYYDQEEMMPVEFNTMITEDLDIYISWVQFEYFFVDAPDIPDDEHIRINGVIGDHNYLYVPAIIDGVEVQRIGTNAFRHEPFYEVYLPETIETLYGHSFADMPNLTSIVLPNSLTYAQDGIFFNSTALREVTLSSNMQVISPRMFENTAIESIVIPEGYEHIGFNAFSNTPLATVSLPSTLISIGNDSFSNTLITEITLPEGVTHLYSYAFRDCQNLITVSLPESLSAIGSNPFRGANSLTTVTLPESNPYFEIVDNVFFSENLEVLYVYLPYKQETNYTIPESVVYASRYSFTGNSFLETLLLPDSIQNYYITETFADMESLSSFQVYDAPGTAVITSHNGVLYSADFNYLYVYPQGKTDTTYSLHTLTLSVSHRAFKDNHYITSVILNNGVERLYDYAFENCINLSAINFPTSLRYIYSGAFYNADSITTINLPDSILSIGYYSFAEMDSLTSLTLNEGLTHLPGRIIQNSNNVTSLNIPSTVLNVSYETLIGGNGLSHLTIDPANTALKIYYNAIYTADYTVLLSIAGGYQYETFYMRQETVSILADFGTNPNIKIIQVNSSLVNFQSNVRNLPNLQGIVFYNTNSVPNLYSWPFTPGVDEGFNLYVRSNLYDDYLENNTWIQFEEWIVPFN